MQSQWNQLVYTRVCSGRAAGMTVRVKALSPRGWPSLPVKRRVMVCSPAGWSSGTDTRTHSARHAPGSRVMRPPGRGVSRSG